MSRSSITFLDFIFLLLIGVSILWVISFILINPPAKKADIDSTDKYMIVLTWDNTSDSDVDMHLLTPYGPVGYNRRQNTLAYQDKDDLGIKTDAGGKNINKEVIFIKRREVGMYVVNVHMYSKKNYGPENIEVAFYQIKPVHMLLYNKKIPEGLEAGQETTAFVFTIRDVEPFLDFDDTSQIPFITESNQ